MPTRAAVLLTLRLPLSVAEEDQAERLPDSKLSAKMESDNGVPVGVGVKVAAGVEVAVGVKVAAGVDVRVGVTVGVGVSVGVAGPM